MAIVNCPSCGKPISDKAKVCSHCNFDFANQDPEYVQRKANLAKFNQLQKLQNQSMLAILLFVIGAYFAFLGEFPDDDTGMLMYNASVGVTALGFIWYAINRVRITLAKRK